MISLKRSLAVAIIIIVALFSFPHLITKAEAPEVRYSPPIVAISTPPVSVQALITRYAAFYGTSELELLQTLTCESGLRSDAVGDSGTSVGVAQIHLPAHPDITREQALDAEFSVKWAARAFSKGNQWMWTCYKMIQK